jgi:hypothetical protein
MVKRLSMADGIRIVIQPTKTFPVIGQGSSSLEYNLWTNLGISDDLVKKTTGSRFT